MMQQHRSILESIMLRNQTPEVGTVQNGKAIEKLSSAIPPDSKCVLSASTCVSPWPLLLWNLNLKAIYIFSSLQLGCRIKGTSGLCTEEWLACQGHAEGPNGLEGTPFL